MNEQKHDRTFGAFSKCGHFFPHFLKMIGGTNV